MMSVRKVITPNKPRLHWQRPTQHSQPPPVWYNSSFGLARWLSCGVLTDKPKFDPWTHMVQNLFLQIFLGLPHVRTHNIKHVQTHEYTHKPSGGYTCHPVSQLRYVQFPVWAPSDGFQTAFTDFQLYQQNSKPSRLHFHLLLYGYVYANLLNSVFT